MANQQQLDMLFSGVQNWNAWRETHSDEVPDFSEADLENLYLVGVNLRRTYCEYLYGEYEIEADLTKTNFVGANLTGADLTGANLTGADLTNVELKESVLSGANLTGANLNCAKVDSANFSNAFLSNTNLTNANLSDTDLVETNFIGACLDGTNLAGAHMKLTIFGNIDLRNTKGLETVNHHGPSIIGTDTLLRSGGKIPEMLLRKAGVSDALINFTVYPADKQNTYYTCVISYSNHDQEFAEHLYNSLQQIGVRCWYAPEGMTTGPFRSRVGQSFHIYDKLVLSQHSIHIQWAKSVVDETLVEEVNKNTQILFPIQLDNSIMEEATRWSTLNYLPLITQNRNIADFTEWKLPNPYQEAVNQLVLDLQSITPLS